LQAPQEAGVGHPRDHYIETVWGRGYVLRDPDRRQIRAETAVAA
jgi:hypothetical protein